MSTEIKSVLITVRRPLGPNDPGEAAEGSYTYDEESGVVTLVDQSGKPLKRGSATPNVRERDRFGKPKDVPVLWSAKVANEHDARMAAGRLLHQKVAGEKSHSDFWRPLTYPVWKPV